MTAAVAGRHDTATPAGHRTVATAGHVDHGKSTLVRALTGMEPDRLDEERRRGLTIELGYAWTTFGTTTVAFVDVPGHERLVRTMLAGAGAAPAALFVVAADDGWSAQSDEHRDVLDLLEVPGVAVAVTKADTVDDARLAAVVAEASERLAGTPFASAPVVAVDAVSGRGLARLRTVLAEGLTALPAADDRGRPRLWVDRVFAPPGIGTVVTGTLTGGRLRPGDPVHVPTSGDVGRVRALQALGRPVAEAAPGMRVALDLTGLARDAIGRGDALVGGGGWRATAELDAWLRVLPGQQVDRTGAWTLHVGSAAVGCRVLPLDGPLEGPGHGPVRLVLEARLPLVVGDRVVLREAGRRATVAGGVVADPAPDRRPRGPAGRGAHATALAAAATAPPAERPAALLRLAAHGWRPAADVLAAADLTAAPAATRRTVAVVGEALVGRDDLERWIVGTARQVGDTTVDRWMLRTTLREQGAPAAVADAVVAGLLAQGRLVRVGGGLAFAEHAERAGAGTAARVRALLADLLARPFAPEELGVLTARHGIDHRLVTSLVHRGKLVRTGGLVFAGAAVPAALARLVRLEDEVGAFTAAQAKQAWGTTRKYAIPLLEHLDAAGLTVADGDGRRRVTGRGHDRALAAAAGGTAPDGAPAGQSPVGPS
ncbi:selenocysteine-specific translation elongation factor [Egicoccus halophilus]|uniref:Tr-type G domain-containing protein n=1 Tax=Egicoccus halophilus TaxID=1670830 RepID=A0A8J3ET04_9ACTN|nr:selenocysteine-specific translation elongation factor [Egicoccus halophilus]GGI02721.1 hypothetical protein GCM10011354_01320 [Egicoccus halophilus]